MRKQVTFVEHLKKESGCKNGSGHILMRSVESNTRCMDGFQCLAGQQMRGVYRGTLKNVQAGGQHMKMAHTRLTMLSAPFLQHSPLTAGQRRYVCSIANVSSTEDIRRQMKQHYLNVINMYIQSGQSDTCRRKGGDRQHRENCTLTKDAGKDETRSNVVQRQRKSKRADTDFFLPKIVNR